MSKWSNGAGGIEYSGFVHLITNNGTSVPQRLKNETEEILVRLRAVVAQAQANGVSLEETFQQSTNILEDSRNSF